MSCVARLQLFNSHMKLEKSDWKKKMLGRNQKKEGRIKQTQDGRRNSDNFKEHQKCENKATNVGFFVCKSGSFHP